MYEIIDWPPKNPLDNWIYGFNWERHIPEADTIASVLWIVPEGLIRTGQGLEDKITKVRLNGGIIGKRYLVTCRITNQNGDTLYRSAHLTIKIR